jgi:hypothetical protein
MMVFSLVMAPCVEAATTPTSPASHVLAAAANPTLPPAINRGSLRYSKRSTLFTHVPVGMGKES